MKRRRWDYEVDDVAACGRCRSPYKEGEPGPRRKWRQKDGTYRYSHLCTKCDEAVGEKV